MDIFTLFFGWPNGGIWSNLLASIIWSTPAFIIGFRKLHKQRERHHHEQMDHLRAIRNRVEDKL